MGSFRKIRVDVGPLLLNSISKFSMAVASNKSRASPFRESEWDRRLDGLLNDLENSTNMTTEHKESRQVSHSRVQHHNHQMTKSKSSCSLGTSTVSASAQQNTAHSGHVTTDNMLKDLDVALRASRNYIESAHDEKMRVKTGDGFNLERQLHELGCLLYSSYLPLGIPQGARTRGPRLLNYHTRSPRVPDNFSLPPL